ncbi:hypothetical protein HMPREF1544_07874 [Mucor circinelloides 1006PhL]|uniref:Retrotransposon gag domain-containing protein n=1 Tax=Mucor circinelloides f. circinelloides (strain 1006PhL) TaxID=1220926 RepID=S2JA83_MUCC1|nr:hypothetical protein HMPREF1544_07874 [Mucor circinelloides 1006PhL]
MSESNSNRNPSASINNLLPSNGMRFVPSPTDFDGRDATDEAERWLIKLNQILKVNKVENIETIMAITGSYYLKGKALDWWYSVQEQVKTFKEFEELFKKRNNNILRQLFRVAGVTDDGTKKAIFVASVLPSIGYELERILVIRKRLPFEDLVDKATEHEALMLKYDRKKEAMTFTKSEQKKVVLFDLDNGSSKNFLSEGSSISSVLSDLVNEMRALLKISSSVEQKELIQQHQQHMIAQQHNMVIQ